MVEQLQREVLWMKRLGVAAAIVVVVFILVYRHQRYRSVTAQAFILEDSLGRQRAKLAFLPEGPGLEIVAASGESRVQLVGGGEEAVLNLSIPVTAAHSGASINFLQNQAVMATFRANLLDLHPSGGSGAATLSLQHGGASLILSGAGEEAPKVSLETNANRACAALNGPSALPAKSTLCLDSPGLPALELIDLVGNRTILRGKQSADRPAHQ
jgi:hypothetical protein